MAYIPQLSFMEQWNLDSAASRQFIQRYIDEFWRLITYKESKIISALSKGKEVAAVEIEGMMQRGYPRYIKAQCTTEGQTHYVTFSGTINGVTLDADMLNQLMGQYSIVQKIASGVVHQVQVTQAAPFSSLKCTAAAYGGTAWADDGSAITYLLQGQPQNDTDDFKEPRALPRQMIKTYTHTFKRHVEMTYIRQKLAQYGVQDELLHQVNMHLRDMKDELARALVYDIPKNETTTPLSALATPASTMRGILAWTAWNQVQEANTLIYVDAGGAPLDPDMLDAIARNGVLTEQWTLDRGDYQIMMHGNTRMDTHDWQQRFRRTTGDETKVGFHNKTIELKEGQEMELVADDLIDPSLCFMLPTKEMQWGYFEGDTFRRDLQNMNARYKQWMIHGTTWGVLPTNPRAIGLIYNLGYSLDGVPTTP
jgi:hypothetical protein